MRKTYSWQGVIPICKHRIDKWVPHIKYESRNLILLLKIDGGQVLWYWPVIRSIAWFHSITTSFCTFQDRLCGHVYAVLRCRIPTGKSYFFAIDSLWLEFRCGFSPPIYNDPTNIIILSDVPDAYLAPSHQLSMQTQPCIQFNVQLTILPN